MTLPALADIEAAARRLEGHGVKTPLLESLVLNDRVGGRVLIKPEVLQRTGSFKFRGAFNKISQIPEEKRKGGVIAYSSGNHAQGVAAAARELGLSAAIIMPSDAPRIKIENTRETLARERDATLVRPYDDPDIVAGQGTCGLELLRQAEAAGAKLDAVLVCCGGGGLIAGISTVIRAKSPNTSVYCVEPEGFDDTRRSLEAGQRVTNEPGATSICDALLSPTPGELTFEINRKTLNGGLAVSDREVRSAMAFASLILKLTVEPG
jgi:threonine dehydratase